MIHHRTTRAAAAIALAVASSAFAANSNLYWMGGSGDIVSANYYNQTTGVSFDTPVATNEFLFIGDNGTATVSDGETIALARLRVGHNFSDGGTAAPPGPGTLNITGGTLTLNGTTGSGGVNAGLLIGYNNDGTVNLSNNAAVTVGQFVTVGFDSASDTATGTGTASLNLANSSSLSITLSNLNIGTGVIGNVSVADTSTLTIASTTGDMVVGVDTTSSFNQTGGTTSVGRNIYVGRSTATNTSLSVSGGTLSGNALTVSDGTGDNNSLTVTGTAAVNLTGGITAGTGTTTNTTVTFSGSAMVTAAGAITMGNSGGSGITWNIADNATVSAGTVGRGSTSDNIYFGRSGNATLNMTGGSLSVAQYFLMGTSSSGTTAPNDLANISGGTITSGSNFVVNDSAVGDSTVNLSGTGAVNVGGRLIVGRQHGTGTMNQTGGSVTTTYGVRIADAQSTADYSVFATGTYNISGGTLVAAVPDGYASDALAVAPSGTGILHITGGDATITVTGNMSVGYLPAADPYPAAQGTLAYTLETGESLTEINVSGTATFSLGSILSLDLAGTTPSQTSYDLLTAADIIDNGLVFSAPAGWNYQIITGGNGEILQAFTTPARLTGDTNGDGAVDLTDLNNVLNNFGVNATGNPGDDNMDGMVDLTDLNDVLNNFGTHTPAASGLSVVPEPATLSLLGIGALGLLARRRRRA